MTDRQLCSVRCSADARLAGIPPRFLSLGPLKTKKGIQSSLARTREASATNNSTGKPNQAVAVKKLA